MKILALDPGHTTGYSLAKISAKEYSEDITLKSPLKDWIIDYGTFDYHFGLEEMIEKYKPDIIVFEEFRLYSHRANCQIGSDIKTLQVIGIIKYLCNKYKIPFHKEMAVNPKKFSTDDKLKTLGVYFNNKHSRDSMRHLLYYLIFNKGKEKLDWYD